MSKVYEILTVQRIEDNEVFSVLDKIETTYNTAAIKPTQIQRIEEDKNTAGGLALIGDRGVRISINIAKHVEV